MGREKTAIEFETQLRHSLLLIERDLADFHKFPLRWQNLATQLRKIFYPPKTGKPPLLDRLLPNATFHATFGSKETSPNAFTSWPIRYADDGKNVSHQAFETEKPAQLSRAEWLEQTLCILDRTPIRVHDVIRLAADKEAVHVDAIEPDDFVTLKTQGFQFFGRKEGPISSYALLQAIVAQYAFFRVRQLLDARLPDLWAPESKRFHALGWKLNFREEARPWGEDTELTQRWLVVGAMRNDRELSFEAWLETGSERYALCKQLFAALADEPS